MDQIHREVRLLKGYALVSTTLFAVLIFMAAKNPAKRAKFEEIDAERINIVEPDGKVRLTLTNEHRMPGGRMAGVQTTSREGNRTMSPGGPPTAGLLFFNDDGDECGGLSYGNRIVDGKENAVVSLTFDHYGQNEAIGLTHNERNGKCRSGLEVWDTGTPFTAEFIHGYNDILKMQDGPEKDESTVEDDDGARR